MLKNKLLFVVIGMALCLPAHAAEKSNNNNAEALAKKLANPVAALISLPL